MINVIRLNPENTEAYNNRGRVKSELGDFEGAIADCDNAIRLNPEDAAAYNHRGIEKAKLGESKAEQAEIAAQQHYQDAIHDWTQAIKLDSEHVPAYKKNRGLVKTLSRSICSESREYDNSTTVLSSGD